VSTASRHRALPRLRVPRPRLPRPAGRRWLLRLLVGVLVLAALLTGAFFWVRQSSLVAVQRVSVTGVSGPDASAIRQVLVRTAERMTTMEIDRRRLRAVVSQYSFVRSLHVSVQLPHSATIAVFEQVPVGVFDGTTVSAHGTLLRGVSATSRPLPTITSSSSTEGGTGDTIAGTARADVYLLAAAPYPIIAKLATAGWKPGRGLAVTLRGGPVIYFGDDTQLAAKWRSVIRVLADPSSAGASYIDVTDPNRPAAGTGSDTHATEPTASASALAATSADPTTTATETTTVAGVTTTN
jgi:cell division protein FtsQ